MEMRRNMIKFSTFDAKGSEDMKRTIPEDMKNLNNGDVGTKTGYKANGYFLKVEGLKDRCAYVYTHTQHAQCSQTRLLQISYCLQAEQKKLYLPECQKNDHKCLLPFFYPNDVVLDDYEHALRGGCDNLKPDIEELQKIVASQAPHIGTPFECPMGSYCFNWSENDWTKRLVHGLQKLLPAAKVTYSAQMGPTWSTDLLNCLEVKEISDKFFFLFRGAPDVIINDKTIMVVGKRVDDDSLTSEDELVENSMHAETTFTGCIPPLSA